MNDIPSVLSTTLLKTVQLYRSQLISHKNTFTLNVHITWMTTPRYMYTNNRIESNLDRYINNVHAPMSCLP